MISTIMTNPFYFATRFYYNISKNFCRCVMNIMTKPLIKKYAHLTQVLLVVFAITWIQACSTQKESEQIKDQQSEDKVMTESNQNEENSKQSGKPVVSSSKPKVTKPVSEMEPVPEEAKDSEIKIVPNRYPMEEKKKTEQKEDDN